MVKLVLACTWAALAGAAPDYVEKLGRRALNEVVVGGGGDEYKRVSRTLTIVYI